MKNEKKNRSNIEDMYSDTVYLLHKNLCSNIEYESIKTMHTMQSKCDSVCIAFAHISIIFRNGCSVYISPFVSLIKIHIRVYIGWLNMPVPVPSCMRARLCLCRSLHVSHSLLRAPNGLNRAPALTLICPLPIACEDII